MSNTITLNGKEYPSMAAVARAHKINQTTLQRRLKTGMSLEQAVSTPRRSFAERGRMGADRSEWRGVKA